MLAIAKRLLQLSLLSEPNFICASLYLFSHLISARPFVFSLVTSSASENPSALKGEDGEAKGKEKVKKSKEEGEGVGKGEGKEEGGKGENEYDPRKRDPKYAGGESSKAWEISQLVTHYHPSVVSVVFG